MSNEKWFHCNKCNARFPNTHGLLWHKKSQEGQDRCKRAVKIQKSSSTPNAPTKKSRLEEGILEITDVTDTLGSWLTADEEMEQDEDICNNAISADTNSQKEILSINATHDDLYSQDSDSSSISVTPDNGNSIQEEDDNVSTVNNLEIVELTTNTVFEEMYVNFTQKISFDDVITIKLLYLLSGERNIPITLFEKIMAWRNWSVQKQSEPIRLQKSGNSRYITKRKEIISHYSDILNVNHLNSHTTEIQSVACPGRSIPVHYFSFKSMLISLLSDDKIMTEKNLLINVNTLRSTSKGSSASSDNNFIGDVNTGSWYKQTEAHYHSLHLESNSTSKMLFIPIILFVDEISVDAFSHLQLTPVTFTLSIFNKATRNLKESWRPLGYVKFPNTEKSSNAREKLQDFHNTLSVVLKELKDCCNSDIHLDTLVIDKSTHQNVTLKFALHYIIGDCKGNNELCGKSNYYASTLISRDCNCTYEQSDDPHVKCEFLKMSDIRQKPWKVKWEQYSHYDIENAFYGFNIGLNPFGINGCTPAELLHFILLGILSRWQEDAFNRLNSKKSLSNFIEQIYSILRPYLRVNNNTTYKLSPRFRFTKGLLKTYHLTAHEKLNQLLLMLVVFQTNRFLWDVQYDEDFIAFIRCAERLLMFYGWLLQEKVSLEDVDIAEKECIPSLMEDIRKHIKRVTKKKDKKPEQEVGWKLFKFHWLLHICKYIRRYGVMSNYDGGPSESHLKHFGTQPAQNTQKRHDSSFEKQVCQRFTEKLVINTCHEIIEEHYPETELKQYINDNDESNTLIDPSNLRFKGKKYTVFFTEREIIYPRKTYHIKVVHGDINKTDVFQNAGILKHIEEFCAMNNLNSGWFCIYTEVHINETLYRAHYEFSEGDSNWFSWCNIAWESPGDKTTQLCPGQLLLICDIRNIQDNMTTEQEFKTSDSPCMLVIRSTDGWSPVQDKRVVDGKAIPAYNKNETSIFKIWKISTGKVHFLSHRSVQSPAYVLPNVKSTKRIHSTQLPNPLGRKDVTSIIEVTDTRSWGDLFLKTYRTSK